MKSMTGINLFSSRLLCMPGSENTFQKLLGFCQTWACNPEFLKCYFDFSWKFQSITLILATFMVLSNHWGSLDGPSYWTNRINRQKAWEEITVSFRSPADRKVIIHKTLTCRAKAGLDSPGQWALPWSFNQAFHSQDHSSGKGHQRRCCRPRWDSEAAGSSQWSP